jgi:hypothetical protein
MRGEHSHSKGQSDPLALGEKRLNIPFVLHCPALLINRLTASTRAAGEGSSDLGYSTITASRPATGQQHMAR